MTDISGRFLRVARKGEERVTPIELILDVVFRGAGNALGGRCGAGGSLILGAGMFGGQGGRAQAISGNATAGAGGAGGLRLQRPVGPLRRRPS